MRHNLLVPLLFGFCATLSAQGTSSSTVTAPIESKTLLIGQRVPDTWTITASDGKERTLLSFKAPLEVMIVFAFSDRCPGEAEKRADYLRLFEHFKEWRVAAVALYPKGTPAPKGLPFPVVEDRSGTVLAHAGLTETPRLAVIDELGSLRFRGTLDAVRKGHWEGTPLYSTSAYRALDRIIGHVDPVDDPEPQPTPGCPL